MIYENQPMSWKIFKELLKKRRSLKNCLENSISLLWQPEFLIESNSVNNFKEDLQRTFLPSLVQIGPAVWEEEVFKENVDDTQRTTHTRWSSKLPLSTLCSGELKKCLPIPLVWISG